MALGEEALAGLLKEINELPGVRGSALVTRDGLPHDFQIRGGVNEEVFAAMGATILGAAETALFELGQDGAKRIVVESATTTLLLTEAGQDLILVVACTDKDQVDEVYQRAKRRISADSKSH